MKMCLSIVCFLILLPFLAFICAYINYLIINLISYLVNKWDNYQINKNIKEINKLHIKKD